MSASAGANAVAAEQVGPRIKRKRQTRSDCPYLDTVNRAVLDFDLEKVCSVSLRSTNVYACLVCGRYFQVACSGERICLSGPSQQQQRQQHVVICSLRTQTAGLWRSRLLFSC